MFVLIRVFTCVISRFFTFVILLLVLHPLPPCRSTLKRYRALSYSNSFSFSRKPHQPQSWLCILLCCRSPTLAWREAQRRIVLVVEQLPLYLCQNGRPRMRNPTIELWIPQHCLQLQKLSNNTSCKTVGRANCE
ncbi:hypothetical protein BDZ97DRAFT_1818879 [Flammula alnicola]|nr:hypothetical protein BDZ97DRAFT_1818879 [Flammula alnicola]